MTVTYNDSVANNRLNQVLNAIDVAAAGSLVIGTSALSGSTGRLVVFTLSHPSGSVAARVFTITAPITGTAIAGGTAAKAELRDSTGTVVASGLTCGITGSGADVILDTVSIVNGRTVFLLSAALTHP